LHEFEDAARRSLNDANWTIYSKSATASSVDDIRSMASIRAEYEQKLLAGEESAIVVNVRGRILARRDSGSVLSFFTLRDVTDDAAESLQVQLQEKAYEANDYDRVRRVLRRGDIVECRGLICKTPRGELTIVAHAIQWQSACLMVDDARIML
jgi:lysyl-tRNA synthetase class II